jgi:hypothetical protein
MRHTIWLLSAALVLGGCSTRSAGGVPVPRDPDGGVVIVDDEGARSQDGRTYGRAARVPPGHYPPPGECAGRVRSRTPCCGS